MPRKKPLRLTTDQATEIVKNVAARLDLLEAEVGSQSQRIKHALVIDSELESLHQQLTNGADMREAMLKKIDAAQLKIEAAHFDASQALKARALVQELWDDYQKRKEDQTSPTTRALVQELWDDYQKRHDAVASTQTHPPRTPEEEAKRADRIAKIVGDTSWSSDKVQILDVNQDAMDEAASLLGSVARAVYRMHRHGNARYRERALLKLIEARQAIELLAAGWADAD